MLKKSKTVIFALLLIGLLNPFLYSCSPKMTIGGQSKHMPSAYTHTGKYIKYNRPGKRHDVIKQYSLKCPIPPAPKK
jgi:hypothetical protein